MSKDIFSLLNKSKSSITKPPLSPKNSKSNSLPSQLIPNASSLIRNSHRSQTHKFTIVDEYLIKVTPITPFNFEKESKGTQNSNQKIVSFDLDGTLITTKSETNKFARGPHDWKWFNDKVLKNLQKVSKSHPIIVFTNQGGVVANPTTKSYVNLTKKLELILNELKQNDVDVSKIWIYASPKKSSSYKGIHKDKFDSMRKPNDGMFKEFLQDFDKSIGNGKVLVDHKESLYIGDAAGREDDFSDSDLRFAQTINWEFKTPEEYFI